MEKAMPRCELGCLGCDELWYDPDDHSLKETSQTELQSNPASTKSTNATP